MFRLQSSYLFGWVLLALSLAVMPAHADLSIDQGARSAIIYSEPIQYHRNDPGATVIEHTLMPPGSRFQAYALADLSQGILRASAVSDILAGSSQFGSTLSEAAIKDTFSFSGASTGQTVSLDFLFEGTISRNALSPIFACCSDANHGGEGGLTVRIVGPSGQIWSSTQWLQDNGCWARSDPCATGMAIQKLQHLVFPVLSGTYNVLLDLRTSAEAGYTVDFSNTARFYLDMPPNVTLQSSSGALFATATPVPEPATALLWLLGGCVLLTATRRR